MRVANLRIRFANPPLLGNAVDKPLEMGFAEWALDYFPKKSRTSVSLVWLAEATLVKRTCFQLHRHTERIKVESDSKVTVGVPAQGEAK